MQRPLNYLFILITSVALSACSNTKYLQKSQLLYINSSVEVKGDASSIDKQNLRSSLTSKQLMMQQSNKPFIGTRFKVWLYNQKYNEKKSNWFWNLMLSKRNLDEPVIYDSLKTKESVKRMVSYMNNQGYFYATVDYHETIKKQKVSVKYKVNTGRNFIINKIDYEIPDSSLLDLTKKNESLSLIKPGMAYKQELLGSERERLMRVMRNAGYYKFDRDAIEFEIDTLHKMLFRNLMNPFEGIVNVYNEKKGLDRPTMDITVKIRNPDDSAAHYDLYHIDSIYTYPDYPAYGNTADSTFKELQRKDLTIRYRQSLLKPAVLSRSVLLRSSDLYSQQKTNDAINRLYDLGAWQFVTLQYKEKKDTSHKLDAYIYLTPKRRQEIGANFEVSTSSDYLLGSGITLNYKHLNIARSATQLNITLNGGIELIRNQANTWMLQSQEIGGQVSLIFPRFIIPFFKVAQTNRSTGRTRLTTGVDYLTRIDKFYISNVNASFGYEWNESQNKRWIVKPISLNYVGVNLNKLFRDSTVAKNPYLQRSFEPAFIGGENVTYIFSNNDIYHKLHNSYFRANIEESGAWLNGINSLWGAATNYKTNLDTLTHTSIANFVKLEVDYRHYWNLTTHTTLATRAYAGVGIAYGHSSVLPYIRQFTAGGPNSIRAWRLRTLGPGTYKDTSATAISFPDQTGDMKLEGNVEYRFDLLRLFNGTINLKGATFLDAGNIWMLRKDADRPGSNFQLSNFYHDLAVGTGAGLRLDFSFFLIRLDWGIPIKVPYFTGNKNGWYLSEWQLGDGRWRRDNIIWNIAIGYPF
ncbi:BamA/TamA family outer membrane protein [Chitinophaga oryziterrae]|uniref:BamA/TamA family outer membrane protein n=1 Tax=Chitinophaga oryziterrae TaxID=1031224 RepID=A0A6N8J6V6_9BACT|nr:BamA/TamA family outer membrane protein [Chitinophaga oryziterrae]MVT40664.1 BamA/TamA family outer membrane protein [Chitinophaga oryziterrae]